MSDRAPNGPTCWDARRDGAALAVLLALALALQLLVYDRWISMLDEGAIAQMGEQILHGKLPYREGVHLAFPGIFFLTAGLFATFEPSFLVGRVFMVAAFSGYIALFYFLARTFASRKVAFLTGLLAVSYRMWVFPHWQMLSYTPIAILCVLLGVAILSIEIGKPSIRTRAMAGLAIGTGIIFKQDSTSIALAAFSLFVGVRGWQRECSFAVGAREAVLFGLAGSTPVILMLLAFAPSGLSGEILYQTVWVPLVAKPLWASTSAGGAYTGFPPLWPLFEQTPAIRTDGFFTYLPGVVLDLFWRDIIAHPLYRDTVLIESFVRLIYTLPYALLIGFTAREVVRARSQSEGAAVATLRFRLVLVLGAAALLSFNRPRDWVHLMVLYTPTLLLLGAALEWAHRRWRAMALGIGAVGAGGALLLAFLLASSVQSFYTHPLSSPRAGIRVSEHMSRVLEPLVGSLMPAPGTSDPPPLAALPASPTLNFLTGRPLATRFITLLPLEEFPDRDEQVLRDLARDPRTEYVYSLQRAAISTRPQDYAPGVFLELAGRYRLGAGPGEIFSGTHAEGALFARLIPREPLDERILYDFAQHRADSDRAGESNSVSLDMLPFELGVLIPEPPLPPAESILRFRPITREPGRLRFSVSMNPDRWASFMTCALQFRAIVDGEVRFEQTLDPRQDFRDRRWVDIDLPIASGEHEIELRTRAENAFCSEAGIAGWARPRIVAE